MDHDPRFLKGIDEFNRGLFYQAHETLEEIWLEDHGPEREFYQGIIQVAAGYFKWEQDVPRGAFKLLRAGVQRIEPYRPTCLGVDVTDFLANVGADLAALETWYSGKGAAPEPRMPPRLSLAGGPESRSRASRD